MLMLVCLLGKFACIQGHFSFCANRHFPLHFTQRFFFNVEPLVSIYFARKIHQNDKPLLRAFSALIQKAVDPYMSSNKLTGGFYPLAIFSIRNQKCKQKPVFGNSCISHPTQSSNECTKINKTSMESTTSTLSLPRSTYRFYSV